MAAIAEAPRLPVARSAGGWLFGPAPDLLLGCGLLSLLARAHSRSGNARAAAAEWEAALAFSPNHSMPHRRAAQSWLAAGEASAALAHELSALRAQLRRADQEHP